MTITIPEYWLWIASAMFAISIALNMVQGHLTRKLRIANEAKAEADRELTKTLMLVVNACMDATKAMNAETGSQWMRIKGVKHVDIKSKLIANNFANGTETMQFKNGVIVVAEERGTRTLMDT